MPKKSYSLRETKYAKTKIALARAFLERLMTARFSDISIKEVCDACEVSEGTFYNYFPNKIDIARYIERLAILKITWAVQQKGRQLDPFEMIEYTFDLMAMEMSPPFLFYEIVSLFTSERVKAKEIQDLSETEKYYAFPECPGVEKIKTVTINDLFSQVIGKAWEKGMISKKIDKSVILLSLKAIMIGVPLAIEMEEFDNLGILFRRQLSLLWEAIRSGKPEQR